MNIEVFRLYVLFLSFMNQTNNKNLIIILINYSTKYLTDLLVESFKEVI